MQTKKFYWSRTVRSEHFHFSRHWETFSNSTSFYRTHFIPQSVRSLTRTLSRKIFQTVLKLSYISISYWVWRLACDERQRIIIDKSGKLIIGKLLLQKMNSFASQSYYLSLLYWKIKWQQIDVAAECVCFFRRCRHCNLAFHICIASKKDMPLWSRLWSDISMH